ncbi:class I SAM-dependent methyltransferase [Spirillospora sp. NPDC047279]|uniref:class I SAM-dependent methyltransferase n=1 Tax=Spirillospora sp. NPDC047279 TaxID=3155478 RepID=UPI0033C758A3
MTGFDRAADAERYEVVSGQFDNALLDAAAIGPSDRVLDIGCGYGGTARKAAALASHVLGNDIAEPLIGHARSVAEAEGLRNIVFETGDAQTHPFTTGGFDVAISRFGVMFFADPVAAFANIGRALRPGGRLAFTTLGPPEGNDLPKVVAAAMPAAAAVHSLSDGARLEAVVTKAGFAAVRVTPVERTIRIGADAAAAADFILNWGAFGDENARPVLTEAARPYETPGAVRLRSTAWLVTAVKP